jgi:hypothetical protein
MYNIEIERCFNEKLQNIKIYTGKFLFFMVLVFLTFLGIEFKVLQFIYVVLKMKVTFHLDFNHSPCSEICILSFGVSPGF